MKKLGFVFAILVLFLVAGPATASGSNADAIVRWTLDAIGATEVECPATEVPYAHERLCATFGSDLHAFRQAWSDYLETDVGIPVESGEDWVMGWGACAHRDYRIGDTGVRVTIDFHARMATIEYRDTIPDGSESGLSRPAIVKETKVKVPKEARKNEITGKVVLEVVVQEDGSVADLALDWACPQGYGLEQAAADAVRRWQFEPAVRDGAPVRGSTTVLVEFRRNVAGKATVAESYRPAPVLERAEP